MAWKKALVDAIIKSAQEDWRAGVVSRKFYLELSERHIEDGDVTATLSRRSSIVFYIDEETDLETFGFYHERLNLFVAWSPRERPGLVTAFLPDKKDVYLNELKEVRYVWQPR